MSEGNYEIRLFSDEFKFHLLLACLVNNLITSVMKKILANKSPPGGRSRYYTEKSERQQPHFFIFSTFFSVSPCHHPLFLPLSILSSPLMTELMHFHKGWKSRPPKPDFCRLFARSDSFLSLCPPFLPTSFLSQQKRY